MSLRAKVERPRRWERLFVVRRSPCLHIEESHAAYLRIAVTPLEGTGGQTVWVERAAPHRVVKMEAALPAAMGGGTATAVLAE